MTWELTVSWSEIDTYRQCPMKHRLGYVERWQGPETAKRDLGHKWHALQQRWRNTLMAERIDDVGRVMGKWLDAWMATEAGDDRELLTWMFAGYLEHWGTDPHWQPVATEYGAAIELPCPPGHEPLLDGTGRTARPVKVKLKSKIDLVVIDRSSVKDRLLVVDYKSSKNKPSEQEMERLDQFGLYVWLLRQIGRPAWGAVHDHARTQRNVKKPQPLDERFHRSYDWRGDDELAVIAAEAYATIRRAWQPVASTLSRTRKRPDVRRSLPGRPERNPDADRCGWRCDFNQACFAARREAGDPLDSYMASFGFKRSDYTGLKWVEE